jgi:CRP/FNR family cyclic AMP-dependent transcriptional regulator
MHDFATHASVDSLALAIQTILADPSLEARRMSVPAGTVIYEPQAHAQHVHFIHRGQVRLYQVGDEGAARLCEILGSDEWFGVGALAKQATYGVRAVAVVQTIVTEVRADRLLAALSRRPETLVEFNRQLATKLQDARNEAAELIFRDTNQRLLNALVRFSRSAASSPREDGVVLNITHSQLAQAVGAARETISLALTQLRLQNLVRTGRNQLFFTPDTIQRLRGELRGVAAERLAAVEQVA